MKRLLFLLLFVSETDGAFQVASCKEMSNFGFLLLTHQRFSESRVRLEGAPTRTALWFFERCIDRMEKMGSFSWIYGKSMVFNLSICGKY